MNQITLVPEGGLCNRIYALTSAIGFAKKHNLRLTAIWFKDWGMGAGFHDLFELFPSVENVKVKDANFGDFFKYAKPIKSNLFLPKLYQKRKFDTVYFWYKEQLSVEEWYFSHPEAHAFYLFHCQKFYDNNNEFLNLFSPVNSIQKRIDERVKLLSPHTTGIHIRRTDLRAAITQSPLSAFIEKMQQEIVLNPNVNFYLASDSREEKKNLTAIFGDRIITFENNLKRNTKEGIVDALVELHTLAFTKKILGSFHSSYSTLASEIKNIPIEIVQI
jgi:hypothetical protein